MPARPFLAAIAASFLLVPIAPSSARKVTSGNDHVPPPSQSSGLAGRVVAADGAAVANAVVRIRGFAAGSLNHLDLQYTAADGSFSFSAPPPGDYTVCVETEQVAAAPPNGYLPECYDGLPATSEERPVALGAGQSLRLDIALDVAGAIAGLVTDEKGAAVAGASVRWSAGSVPTDAQGRYFVPRVTAGAHEVCVDSGQAATAAAPYGFVGACRSVTATLGAVARADLRPVAGGAISGTITRPNGLPSHGTSSELRAADGRIIATTLGDRDADGLAIPGRYSFQGIAPGTYTVCVNSRGSGVYFESEYRYECVNGVTVIAGRAVRADVRLHPA